jgi:subtilisin family serine protease
MRRTGLSIAAALCCLLLAAPAAQALPEQRAQAEDAPATPNAVFSKTHLIVQWTAGADRRDIAEAREDAEVDFAANLGDRRFQLVEVEFGQSASDALATLRASSDVVLAGRDGYAAPHAIPDDPLFGQLWGLRNAGLGINGFTGAVAGADIDALGAWLLTTGTPGTVVAVLDSGYRFEHPDLANVAWTNTDEIPNGEDDDGNGIVDDLQGADFVGPDAESPVFDGNPTDDDLLSGGHGVHTAGTIGAQGNNGTGITGVAQDIRIMPLRVCSHYPSLEDSRCPFSSQIAAINYAGDEGARVANMSLGGPGNFPLVGEAIADNPGTLFVVSAGNDGEDNEEVPQYPCNYDPVGEGNGPVDNVICVAATDQADGLAEFSNWGADAVDLGAPGTETLSTYPARSAFQANFEAADFESRWTATGPDGGFARSNEPPLTSFGMTDSPGEAPVADSVRESTSVPIAIPAGLEPCTLFQTRNLSLGSGGTYTYQVLLDGSPVDSVSPTSSGRFSRDLGSDLGAGGEFSLRFRYEAGPSPSESNGVWIDDIELQCTEGVGIASGYAYLEGTSMAAPHVSGTAALLFSLEPSASVSEVRAALLTSVDPDPALAGITTTGGRLDAAAALEALDVEPPDPPQLTGTDPPSPNASLQPRILGLAETGTTVSIYAGLSCAGSPVATGGAAELSSPGIAVNVAAETTSLFSARATDEADNQSACSASISYTHAKAKVPDNPPDPPTETPTQPKTEPPPPPPPPPPACTVPKLIGKTLARAKAALTAASCKLGTVRKPRPRPGKRLPALVVKASTPTAGAQPISGKVNLRLGPKPRKARR